MSEVLLNIIIPKALEDGFTDWLLDVCDIEGFTSLDAAGRGSSRQAMTALEKVRGRTNKVLVEIITTEEKAAELLEKAAESFTGADLHYYSVPVIRSGHL